MQKACFAVAGWIRPSTAQAGRTPIALSAAAPNTLALKFTVDCYVQSNSQTYGSSALSLNSTARLTTAVAVAN